MNRKQATSALLLAAVTATLGACATGPDQRQTSADRQWVDSVYENWQAEKTQLDERRDTATMRREIRAMDQAAESRKPIPTP